VDVGEAGSHSAPFLFHSAGKKGAYVALSHCWGGDMPVKLLTSNIEQLSSYISLDDLPANFRDAIYIARELRVRYIWIDSLCIIQDSRLDWEIESKTMGEVYQNALLTIAAAASERSTEGILKIYKHKEAPQKALTLKMHPCSTASDTVCLSWKDEEEENLQDLFLHGSLASRGWTLQERVLSHRVLCYGRRQIYWQCRRGYKSADGVPEGNLTPQLIDYPELSRLFAHNCLADGSGLRFPKIYNDWYDLVCEYNTKALTYGSDKFPAVAGLAAKISELINDRYIAGLWQSDISRGLLWYCEMAEAVPFQPYRAPSWSWAATNDAILFLNEPEVMVATQYDAKLRDYHIKLAGQSTFGEVQSAWLLLHGLTGPLLRSKQIIHNQAVGNPIGFAFFDQAEPGDAKNTIEDLIPVAINDEQSTLLTMRTSHSAPLEWEVNQQLIYPREYLMLLVAFSAVNSYRDDEKYTHSAEPQRITRAHALILSHVPETTNSYQRSGYIRFDVQGVDLHTWTSDWGLQDVTLV
jgi:hypothetical protein